MRTLRIEFDRRLVSFGRTNDEYLVFQWGVNRYVHPLIWQGEEPRRGERRSECKSVNKVSTRRRLEEVVPVPWRSRRSLKRMLSTFGRMNDEYLVSRWMSVQRLLGLTTRMINRSTHPLNFQGEECRREERNTQQRRCDVPEGKEPQ